MYLKNSFIYNCVQANSNASSRGNCDLQCKTSMSIHIYCYIQCNVKNTDTEYFCIVLISSLHLHFNKEEWQEIVNLTTTLSLAMV